MHYQGYGRRSQVTPQTEPIPGTSMVSNNAGGFGFAVDDLTRLKRFATLGSSSGTYYVNARDLTKQNLDVVERMLKAGQGKLIVDTVIEVSKAGRGVSNDPALFVLARCAACDVHGKVTFQAAEKTYELHQHNHPGLFERIPDNTSHVRGNKTFKRAGNIIHLTEQKKGGVQDHPDDIEIRRYALQALPVVARTGTHFLHFIAYVEQFRGWGRSLKRTVAAWYNKKQDKDLAYQLIKYQNRDGWSQDDALRLSHPKAIEAHQTLYHWVTKGWEGVGDEEHPDNALKIVWAYEKAKRAQDDKEVASLIKEYTLPREAVPTQFLHSVPVWEALLAEMPMEAMCRNLATMTREGVVKPMGDSTRFIAERLRSGDLIKKARLHPIKILAALTTYQSGKSVRGDATWTPVQAIVDALNEAFYLSFGNVAPTDKKSLIAIDVSASMHGTKVNGIPGMECHTAASAMALVIAASAWHTTASGLRVPNYHVIAFDTMAHALSVSHQQRLDDVMRIVSTTGGGGTNCAVPFQYAIDNKLDLDAIVTLSDSETWFGKMGHPIQILNKYRQHVAHPVKAVNVQMAATHVTNNDPDDKDALEAIGFDTAVPELISAFVQGNF